MTEDEDRENWDETSWMKSCYLMRNGAKPLQTSQMQSVLCKLEHFFFHACVRDHKVLKRARAGHNKTDKHVRATSCSVFTRRRVHGIC